MTDILFNISLPFATAGFLAFIFYMYWRKHQLFAAATVSSLIAFVCLTVMIPLLFIEHGTQALFLNTAREIFIAWVIMLIYFIAEFRYRIRLLGSIVMPVALLFLLLSVLEEDTTVSTIDLRGVPTLVHMILVFVGFSLLFLAFAAAGLYLRKAKALKAKMKEAFDTHLPALTTIKRVMIETFRLSFPVFTLGVILGSIYAAAELPSGWYFHPYFIGASLNWIFFAALYFMHHAQKIGSLVLARMILILFVLFLSLSLFGSHKTMWKSLERAQASEEAQLP